MRPESGSSSSAKKYSTYKEEMVYAAITTGAIFLAVVLNDLVQNNSGKIPQHAILGFISVLIMVVLSQKGYDLVAWGLLLIPLIAFIVSLVGVYLNGSPAATSSVSAAISAVLNTTSKDSSVIGLPASSSAAAAANTDCVKPAAPPKACDTSAPKQAPVEPVKPAPAEPAKPPTGPPGSIASNLSPITACASK
jgi:hypothetical protein